MKVILKFAAKLQLKIICTILEIGCCAVSVGCAQFEQYPHPYAAHDSLPFTVGPIATSPVPFLDAPRIEVCDIQSQITSPVGGYFIEKDLQRPIDLDVNIAALSDLVSQELSTTGAIAERVPGFGIAGIPADRQSAMRTAILKAKVLCMEYSQYGLKRNPYEFLYLIVRFNLQNSNEQQSVWEGDVTVYRKVTPGPATTQQSLAEDAIREATRNLAGNASFRSSLMQNQRGS